MTAAMRRARAIAALIVLSASAPALADIPLPPVVTANPDVVAADHPIVITKPGHRSSYNKQFIGGMAGLGIALAGFGLFYHLDSRQTANSISAQGPTGQPWTAADQGQEDYSHQLRSRAIAFYSVGGAVLVGAVLAWIFTEPQEEQIVIRPRVTPTIAPTPGGAVLGGTWSF